MDSKEDEEISIDAKKSKISGISENSDEEFSIDFGKIKNFFKSDKEEKKTEEHHTKENEDIEFSFDVNKIKKFFKTTDKESIKSDEDITVNWSKIIDFFKKYGIIFIALIPIILSIYVRMQAGFLPITDEWAANSVINSISSQIKSGIDQQYLNLPDSNKNALVDTELQKVIRENKRQIDY